MVECSEARTMSAETKALQDQVEMLKTQLGEMVREEAVWIAAIGRANAMIRDLTAQLSEAKKPQAVVEKKVSFAAEASVTITPVSAKEKKQTLSPEGKAKPDSRRDYNEQCERLSNGEVMCWDDADANKTLPGDMFGFRHHEDRVEIHQVKEVNSSDHRLPSWSRNVGHSKRNVLILTNPLCVIPWEDWEKFGWHASGSLMGTQRVANDEARKMMVEYVNAKIASMP